MKFRNICENYEKRVFQIESVQNEAENVGFEMKHFEHINEDVIIGLNYTAKKYDQLLERVTDS